MTDRYDSLAPKDLIITLRSLDRRFSDVAGTISSDPDLLERVDEPGPDGQGFGHIVDAAASRLEQLSGAIATVAQSEHPVMSADSIATATPSSQPRLPIEQAVRSIARSADVTADVLDTVEVDGWTRSGVLDTGGSVDLITLVRRAVRDSVEGLRSAERTRDWLRGT